MANFIGTAGNDTLNGTAQDDTFNGGSGNDTIVGGGGVDTAVFSHLGPATDLGDDVVFNGDFVSGRRVEIRLGEGNAAGTATVTTTIPAATQEQDTLFSIENVTGSNGTETIVGNSQDNRLLGLGGHDTIFGGGGNDTIEGGSGRDLIDGGTGTDTLDGGTGIDTLSLESFNQIFSPAVFRHTVDLRDGFSSRSSALTVSEPFIEVERDTAINFENVIGSSRDDSIFGTVGNNTLEGRGGNDFIEGRGGLEVEIGSFTLTARDTLDGGEGTDTVSYAYLDTLAQSSLVMRGTITLDSNGQDGRGHIELLSQVTPTFVTMTDDILRDFENVRGSNLSETITGNGEDNRIEGRGGNDTIFGGGGRDTIVGGSGVDRMTGGTGIDTFVFTSANDSTVGARDTITDFVFGTDRIDLSAIDANALTAGNQAFTFIGTSAFTGAGQIRAVITGADQVTLLGNTDSDSFAEFALDMRGNVTTELFFGANILGLGTSDFIL